MRSIEYGLLTIFLLVYVSLSPLFAQGIISVNEILKSPEMFFNQTVRVKGKVIELKAGEGAVGGIYTLRADNTNIPISSAILPELNKVYKVRVQVLQGDGNNPVIFKEVARTRSNPWKYAAYVAGGVLVALAVALTFGGSGTVTTSN